MTICVSTISEEIQRKIIDEINRIQKIDPWITPTTAYGNSFSIKTTNCGEYGWISDNKGYRYEKVNSFGLPWQPIPSIILDVVSGLNLENFKPESCLINYYHHPKAKLGLHRDKDEKDLTAPIVSISLGDSATFLYGGINKKKQLILKSGDVLIMKDEHRLAHHGIKSIDFGSSTLMQGRYNLTLRKVT